MPFFEVPLRKPPPERALLSSRHGLVCFHFCQYIPGLPGPDDSCKCGREVKPRSPYCPEHDARCHPVAEAAEGQERLPVAA